MNADEIRPGLRFYTRHRATVFFVATLLLIAFMELSGFFREEIKIFLGDSGFLWVFGIGAFSSLLLPMILGEVILQRDRRLYCPGCGNFLPFSLRAMIQLNKQSTCANCGKWLPVRAPTFIQKCYDLGYVFGGLILLIVFLAWLCR